MKKIILLILFPVFWCSCASQSEKEKPKAGEKTDTLALKYARGFKILQHESYTELCVLTPWQGAKDQTFSYFLVPKASQVPENLPSSQVIRTPIQNIVCFSTTHTAFLDFIGQTQSISGMSGANFTSIPRLRRQIENGKTREIGYGQNLNYELLVKLKPDIVMVYGVGGETAGFISKLKELGLKVVINAEYLETHPLGKTEWVKFVAAFFDKLPQAQTKFDTIAANYEKLTNRVAQNIEQSPSVLANAPYKDVWYVSPGNSYLASLIADAGGKYLWKNQRATQALPLDIEAVLNKAQHADFWINTGSAATKNDILAIDKRLENFDAFKNNRLFNNNAQTNPTGGNAYMERGTVEPHIILKDLVRIFHPEILPTHKLVYFRAVK